MRLHRCSLQGIVLLLAFVAAVAGPRISLAVGTTTTS